MPRQVVTTALLITVAISALLSGCVTVSPERKNEVAEKLGWVTGSCLAIHNENLKIGDELILHQVSDQEHSKTLTVISRASSSEQCIPLQKDRRFVNQLTDATFYYVNAEELPELAVASIKGYSTRGIKFRACYSNQAVQFFAFKGEQQIWQGYYFVAAQVPETCRGSR
jgi:bifunctional DNA-binding transcriptional regulator/antitoxin component of YhaV-PrlF toxin-antitoxin module